MSVEDLTTIKISSLKFNDETGLIPVVTQEVESKEVLMVAYANREAIEKTLATGFAYYWSRSRKALWMKGETSGNTQKVSRVLVDCDYDTLLYLVKQKGVACHTGKRTCFHNELREI
ncbi:MAG: phosphoribosyl-AMP cyclohydrolase [Candidatus Bathyarchaeota archaeon]